MEACGVAGSCVLLRNVVKVKIFGVFVFRDECKIRDL